MDLINWVRGNSLAGQDFPVQTEQTRNIYYMANTFQIWKKLQANFIEPINTQYARTFTSKYTQSIHCTVHNCHQFEKNWMEKISSSWNNS